MEVGATGLIAEQRHLGEQRQQPGADGRQRHQQAEGPGAAFAGHPCDAAPAAPGGVGVRDEHQRREEAHALADDAEAHGGAGRVEPAPGRAEQQMPSHAVQAEGGPEAEETVDLPGALDAVSLVGGQEQQAGDQADAVVPQARAEVVQAGGGHDAGQQRRQEQGDGRRGAEADEEGDGPHEQRRLVRVDLGGAMGDQPVTALQHLQGHAEEALLVHVGRLAHAQAGADHRGGQQQQEQQQEQQRGALGTDQAHRLGAPVQGGGGAIHAQPSSSRALALKRVRRISHQTPKRSRMPTSARSRLPYLETPAPRGR
ncbi:hypothetical protein D9M68_417210 [compost metagenome]